MKKNFYLIALLAIAYALPVAAQEKATGFSELKLYFDPGHSGTVNKGYGDYSEAEKVLQIAHALKEYLVTYTDMKAENIKLSRTDDSDVERSFDARADECAAMGAHFFYSIHSDAPSTTSGATLYMYGGRRSAPGQSIIEKLPEGGKQFGDILNADLTPVLRLNKGTGTYVNDASRGNMPDLQFYGSSSTTPYLAVNRTTNNKTASLLSEAGFHTNPQQNMQFVNVEFKKMQAYATYQTFVRYLSEKYLGERIEPVQVGIATGFVFDEETNAPVNGAVITVTEGEMEKSYTTDTYESLPKKYTFKPDEFGNGFYWIEGFTPGATVDIKVEAVGFETQTTTLTIPASVGATTIEGLGVKDFKMLNQMPAVVSNVKVTNDMNGKAIPRYPMELVFSRKMDKASVESAISFSPAATVSYSWPNDFTLRVDISNVAFETTYTLTIDGSVAKNSVTNQYLDGTHDGTEGGNYVFTFTTSDLDVDSPVVISYDPQEDQEISARPVVRIEFDEPLNELTIGHTPVTVADSNGDLVEGLHSYHTLPNFKSVIHYRFFDDLKPQETYTVTLSSGIEDMYGNAMTEEFTFDFTARPKELIQNQLIDDFANPKGNGWWDPYGSGTTVGANPALSLTSTGNHSAIATKNTSMRVDYLWESASGVIRLHRRGNEQFTQFPHAILQYYLFGDGSNTVFQASVRSGSSDGSGPIWASIPFEIDWVGWKLMSWDFTDAEQGQDWLVEGGPFTDGTGLDVKEFGIYAAYPTFYDFVSYLLIDDLRVVELGDFLPPTTGIKGIVENGINVSSQLNYIRISANAAISDVKVYSIAGALLKSAQPKQASYQIPTQDLAPGVYIVRATTETSQKNVKVIVK